MTAGAALRHIGVIFGEGAVAGQTDAQLLDRFLTRRDALAFETLVARHGPMVLSTCRATLRDSADAEDAFQATFLVLVRKAGSIRGRDALGPWLHRVSRRVASRANLDSARRRDRERRAGELRASTAPRAGHREELRAALHEEIDRLPDRLRHPVVLCHLESKTHAQAASELRLGEATLRRRLSVARGLLHARLGRRGVAVPVGMLAASFAGSATAAVPEAWTASAVRAAMTAISRGGLAASTATAAAIAGLLTISGLASLAARPGDDPKAGPTPPALANPAPKAVAPVETAEFRGRVLSPQGNPHVGARIILASPAADRHGDEGTRPIAETTTGLDGRFRIEAPTSTLEDTNADPGWRLPTIVATADGFGPAWESIERAREGEITLRLAADDVPLRGRVLDLEGRPVGGARVSVQRVATVKGGDLMPYLNTVRDGTEDGNGRLLDRHWSGPFPGRPASVTADADGRFTLSGFGRERLVEMTAEAPSIQRVTFMAMTRDAEAVGGSGEKELGTGKGQLHGARFELLVPPGRSITGVVRDKATKRPIPGMVIAGGRAVTDAEGRFTAPGFAKGKEYELVVLPDGQPYFVTCAIVADTPGLTPIRADVECVRGVAYRLKVTDKATGKTVHASVSYSPVYPNKWTREATGFEPIRGIGSYASARREPDGTYIGGVLPGPGAIFVRVAGHRYMPASVDPHEFFTGKPGGRIETDGEYGNRRAIMVANGAGSGSMTPQAQFEAIVLTNAPEGSDPLNLEVALERDPGRLGSILGPDGKPLAGAEVDGLDEMARDPSGPLPTAEFRVIGLIPGQTRRLTFTHKGKGLSGFLLVRGDEPEPYVVRLKPWATLTGRLIDADGKPRFGIPMMSKDWQAVLDDPAYAILPPDAKTDLDGRFRFEGLVAGLKYDAVLVNVKDDKGYGIVFDELILNPGEARDLGDVQAKPGP